MHSTPERERGKLKHDPRQGHVRFGIQRIRSLPRFQLVSIIGLVALLVSACATPDGAASRVPTIMQAMEAEEAVIEGSVLAVRDTPGTSGGQVVVSTAAVSPANEGGEDASLPFEVSAEGEYVLWARIKGASSDESAMFLGFDGKVERVELFRFGEFVWVAASVGQLESGEHAISIAHAEPETELDALVISSRRDLTHDNLETFLMTGEMPAPVMPEPSDPATGGPATGEPDGGAGPKAPVGSTAYDLRGDPNFDPNDLPAEAQVWYRRLWKAIDDSVYDAYEWAASDDLYRYARDLHTHVQFLLHAFRVTGDLRLLDEVDKIVEIMRDQLHDSWRGVLSGSTAPGKDGFVNWVWRYSSGDEYVGKDTNKLDEMKTHALIASVAYALDVNRDLPSPGGVNYGAHADFWVDYLVNDFEAKWRQREGEPKGFPIMIRSGTHTYYSWMKWHYYMALLTGNDGYMREAERMAGKLHEDVKEVSTSSGTALLWPKGVLSEGSSLNYLHPTVYARYAFHDAIEFNLEGFGWWDDETLEQMARTITTWVIDPEGAEGSRDWFAGDIGGDKDRAGFPTDGWARMNYLRYEVSSYPELVIYDDSGKIDDINQRVMDKFGDYTDPRYIAFPTAELMKAILDR